MMRLESVGRDSFDSLAAVPALSAGRPEMGGEGSPAAPGVLTDGRDFAAAGGAAAAGTAAEGRGIGAVPAGRCGAGAAGVVPAGLLAASPTRGAAVFGLFAAIAPPVRGGCAIALSPARAGFGRAGVAARSPPSGGGLGPATVTHPCFGKPHVQHWTDVHADGNECSQILQGLPIAYLAPDSSA